MNLGRFVIRNVLRNKRRTGFTVLSIGFSLFLLIVLWTILDILFDPPTSDASALRLVVRRSTSIADNLPIAYMEKVRNVPHVEMIMPLQWFGGYYKEPKNFFGNLAGDPNVFFDMFSELKVSDAARQAFLTDRTAAVVGPDLIERFGWKIGDRITLIGTIFPVDLEFTIVGVYDYEFDRAGFYFRYDYLNEALGDWGQVGSFWVKADRAENIPGIIDTVDAMFHNTAAETKTETEKSFQLNFVSMLGNIRVMIGSIAAVVVFTMLLVSASTMAMTIRERMREVAILKSIGYQRRAILFMIVGESAVISLLGYLFAVALAIALSHSDISSMTKGFVPFFKPSLGIYTMSFATGAAIGLLSGLVPAIQASRLTITQAMRRLE